jgi:hypothetical protein
MYNLRFDKLISQLLPPFMRQTTHEPWLLVLLKPIETLYDRFIKIKTDTAQLAQVTGQSASVEYYLNKRFFGNGELKIIHITDESRQQDIYLFLVPHPKQSFLFRLSDAHLHPFVFASNDWHGPHFVLNVPVNHFDEFTELISVVNAIRPRGFVWELRKYVLDGYEHSWNGRICIQQTTQQPNFTHEWSGGVCVHFQLPPTLYTYFIYWSGQVCVQIPEPSTTVYSHQWTGQVCVQQPAGYNHGWTGQVCVQQPAGYNHVWTGQVCVQQPAGYNHGWTGQVCVQQPAGYNHGWTGQVCVQQPAGYNHGWTGQVCVQQPAGYNHGWTGQVCTQQVFSED